MFEKIKRIHISVLMLLLSLVWLVNACSSTTGVPNSLFVGTPAVKHLDSSITQSHIFDHASIPHAKVFNYQAYEIPSQQLYSNYQIKLVKTNNKLTQYRTTETAFTGATVHGKGLGYGGIFSMVYLKKGALPYKKHFYIKYRWMSISHIKGHLFPLAVGNQLSFNYSDQVSHQPNNDHIPGQSNQGKIIYRVTGELNGYHHNNANVTGKIYIITFSKSIGTTGPMKIQNEYYFSQKLGWYVQAKYYFNHKAMAVYRLKNFHTSLYHMQQKTKKD